LALLQSSGGRSLVLSELKEFSSQLAQTITVLSEAKYPVQLTEEKCGELASKFPTLFLMHNTSLHFAAQLLRAQLVPFNFKASGLQNFDCFLAVRNLLTVGYPASDQEARERNTAFM